MAFSLKKTLKRSYSVRFVAWLLFFNFVDLLVIILPRHSAPKTRKRVIFLKLDGIGDYVVWTATFSAIETMFPSSEYERILIGTDKTKELSENERIFDQKIYLSWDRFIFDPKYRFCTMRQIRDLDADILINPRLTREFLWSDAVVRCSGAVIKIGTYGLDNHMSKLTARLGERWYTKLIASPQRDEHELVSHRKFLNAIDEHFAIELGHPKIAYIPDNPVRQIPGEYAIFFLGASHPERLWPIEKFASVADFVVKTYGYSIVVCGGPGEEELAKKFGLGFSGDFIDLIGKTKLLELYGLMQSAKLIVTNDTGAGHFAAVSKAPTVVITPGNQVGRFFPYPDILATEGIRQISVLHDMPCFGCGWHCIYKDLDPASPKPCIEGVAVDDVNSSITAILAKTL